MVLTRLLVSLGVVLFITGMTALIYPPRTWRPSLHASERLYGFGHREAVLSVVLVLPVLLALAPHIVDQSGGVIPGAFAMAGGFLLAITIGQFDTYRFARGLPLTAPGAVTEGPVATYGSVAFDEGVEGPLTGDKLGYYFCTVGKPREVLTRGFSTRTNYPTTETAEAGVPIRVTGDDGAVTVDPSDVTVRPTNTVPASTSETLDGAELAAVCETLGIETPDGPRRIREVGLPEGTSVLVLGEARIGESYGERVVGGPNALLARDDAGQRFGSIRRYPLLVAIAVLCYGGGLFFLL